MAGALLALLGAWFARAPILEAAANAWVVHDAINSADAIVVLGGGLETRPFAAAALYKNGFAAKILVSDVKPSPAEKLGVVASHVDQNRAVLLKLGIPAEAITGFGAGVTNTYEEAGALAQWTATNGAKRVIVPTELFSSRRVRWILAKELRRTGTQVELQALPTLEYGVDSWWKHEAGVIAFQNEVVKYVYYRLKY
jgi:uncharacterized SAM-binding protein YcdF (DUF218 family)